ncbi:MAG TPA: alpha/beta fold hydrolase [Candidatus Synoicihabitans sp.]|nr:alpha/beta fold hydrolase [Candidatus Synoicihabitans sp.]
MSAALLLIGLTSGCASNVLASRVVSAPNRVMPTMAKQVANFAEVQAQWFPKRWTVAGSSPGVQLAVGMVEAADYGLEYKSEVIENPDGSGNFNFSFNTAHPTAEAPRRPARGTLVLLHGIYTQKESLLPWALALGQRGYRCILVDLRGHGDSSGEKISFGAREVADLRLVLDDLERRGLRVGEVAVFGVSYGAAIGLQWAAVDPRVRTVVALESYSDVQRAVVGVARGQFGGVVEKISDETFARALEKAQRKGGFRWDAVDVSAATRQLAVPVLFIHGQRDAWVPPDHSEALRAVAPAGSELLLQPDDNHLTLPIRLNELIDPVGTWFDRHLKAADAAPIDRAAEL